LILIGSIKGIPNAATNKTKYCFLNSCQKTDNLLLVTSLIIKWQLIITLQEKSTGVKKIK
jgi:hypothetical protein